MTDDFTLSRRALLAAPAALALAGIGDRALAQAAAPALPILPLNTGFSYADHHWIMWPEHPVYEAIECALAYPRSGAEPLIRIWLTERAGMKRQIYYFNDEIAARTFPQESHLADIRLEHRGEPGFAHDMTLSFTDKTGVPLRWEMRFPAGRRVSRERAGLKPQNGHASASVLLFWYVDQRADTGSGRLQIGSESWAVEAADRPGHGYRAAYNQGGYNLVFAFGAAEIAPTPDGFRTSWAGGRAFRREGVTYVAETHSFRQPVRIELSCDAAGALTTLRHSFGPRAMRLDFDQPLTGRASETRFHLAIEGTSIANGILAVTPDGAGGTRLDWRFAEPAYAREAGLTTTLSPRPGGGYGMRVGSTPAG